MPIRQKCFPDQWMEDMFMKKHVAEYDTNATLPKMGYPDCGSGVFSKSLTYEQWYRFNCAQRVHGNSIEHLAWLMPLICVGGVFHPRVTAGLATIVLGGRTLYRIGYLSDEGPTSKIREAGAIPLNIAEILLICSLPFVYWRARYPGLLRNRSFYKSLFVSRGNQQMEKTLKAIKDEQGAPYKIWRKNRSLLPLHPKIM